MKVLVTGGAGFIGSHIADAAIEDGFVVTVVDSLCSGKEENLNQKAFFHKEDICNKKAIEKIFEKEKPDIVCHHAALTSVQESIKRPELYQKVNAVGTKNIAEAAAKFGAKKIVYASTCAVYGRPQELPITESHPAKPLSPYGKTKLRGEQAIKQSGVPCTILRYSNVFGPRQNPKGETGVISIFANQMLQGKGPKIFGGSQTRDFVFVQDVVKANILAFKKIEGGTFNIGTGQETSVNQLFELLKKETGFKGNPIQEKELEGEMKRISLGIKKAEKELGWAPSFDLGQGLKRTVDWLKLHSL
jgi:UDP-glucose 4-epimerase